MQLISAGAGLNHDRHIGGREYLKWRESCGTYLNLRAMLDTELLISENKKNVRIYIRKSLSIYERILTGTINKDVRSRVRTTPEQKKYLMALCMPRKWEYWAGKDRIALTSKVKLVSLMSEDTYLELERKRRLERVFNWPLIYVCVKSSEREY